MSDELRQLVRECLGGDETAVRELVRRFELRVFHLCLRMVGHRQDAEDVAQESFQRALAKLGQYDPGREFSPWLLTIAANRCRSLLARRRTLPMTTPLMEQAPDDAPREADARGLAEEVELGLRTLRPDHRQAFLLYHEQELNYAEIAAALACPLGTAKTWVHRARRELGEYLVRRGVVSEPNHAVR